MFKEQERGRDTETETERERDRQRQSKTKIIYLALTFDGWFKSTTVNKTAMAVITLHYNYF